MLIFVNLRSFNNLSQDKDDEQHPKDLRKYCAQCNKTFATVGSCTRNGYNFRENSRYINNSSLYRSSWQVSYRYLNRRLDTHM